MQIFLFVYFCQNTRIFVRKYNCYKNQYIVVIRRNVFSSGNKSAIKTSINTADT